MSQRETEETLWIHSTSIANNLDANQYDISKMDIESSSTKKNYEPQNQESQCQIGIVSTTTDSNFESQNRNDQIRIEIVTPETDNNIEFGSRQAGNPVENLSELTYISLQSQNQDYQLRTTIESSPAFSNIEIQDRVKDETNSELVISQERVIQVLSGSQPGFNITTTNSNSLQYDNLPPEPPPYSEFPIYTIPMRNRDGLFVQDLPPPYDPTMRRDTLDPLDFPFIDTEQQTRTSRFECKPDTLVPLGFCYCTLEQLIVTLAILGTFVFLFLGQIT